jgi:hypothetical protein
MTRYLAHLYPCASVGLSAEDVVATVTKSKKQNHRGFLGWEKIVHHEQ